MLDAPEVQRTYVGRLDGCLDFFLSDLIRKTFGWETASEADLARLSARHPAYFPTDFIMPSFLDNHDMDRFLYICKGNKDALRRAVDFQMHLPNPPMIYYGTEIGLNHQIGTREGGLDAGRGPMIWDEAQQDRALFAYYAEKIQARKGAMRDQTISIPKNR